MLTVPFIAAAAAIAKLASFALGTMPPFWVVAATLIALFSALKGLGLFGRKRGGGGGKGKGNGTGKKGKRKSQAQRHGEQQPRPGQGQGQGQGRGRRQVKACSNKIK